MQGPRQKGPLLAAVLRYIRSNQAMHMPTDEEMIAFLQGPLPEAPPRNPERCYTIVVPTWNSLLWALASAAEIGRLHYRSGEKLLTVTVHHDSKAYCLVVSATEIDTRGMG